MLAVPHTTDTPTDAEMDAALVFTVDGYSDAEGQDHVTAARKALDAAEAVTPRSWSEVLAEFEAAEAASDWACDNEYEADGDEPERERRAKANAPIYERYKAARAVLFDTRAAHWAGVAVKIGATLTTFGSCDESDSPWCQSARELRRVLLEIGDGAPGDAPSDLVIKARRNAERMAYRAANEPGGYDAWGPNIGALAGHAAAIESIVADTRALSKFNDVHKLVSAEAVNSVWFSGGDLKCEVSALGPELGLAIRTHEDMDRKGAALTAQQVLTYTRAESDLSAVPAAILRLRPASQSGVALQLLAAMGQLDLVQNAVSDDADQAADLIRDAVVNAIRVFDMPFDNRIAAFFMGDALSVDSSAQKQGAS